MRSRGVVLGGVLLMLVSCASPERRFDEARQRDTLEAYRAFLAEAPPPDLAGRARARITELEFAKAKAEDTVPAYEGFLEKHDRGGEADAARLRIAELGFEAASSVGTREAYRAFLAHAFPSDPGGFRRQAEQRIEEIAFGEIQESDAIEELRGFLEEYPDGPHVAEIRGRLDAVLSDRFEAAQRENTPASYREFLELKPGGELAGRARTALEELAYASASRTASPAELRAFLREFPGSEHASEIRMRLLDAAEEDRDLIPFILRDPESPVALRAAGKLRDHEYYPHGCLVPWSRMGRAGGARIMGRPDLTPGVDLAAFELVHPGSARPRERMRGGSGMVVGSKRFYQIGMGVLTFPSWTRFGDNYCIGEATVGMEGLSFDHSSRVILSK